MSIGKDKERGQEGNRNTETRWRGVMWEAVIVWRRRKKQRRKRKKREDDRERCKRIKTA